MFKKLAEIDFLDSMRMKISGVRFLNFPVEWVAKKNNTGEAKPIKGSIV